ncbi:MAG: DUF1059 domain-containing protein [bacterium]|nr:DUF1059 domain-containing protein [bacterium]
MKLTCKDINPSTACTFSAEAETSMEAAEKMLAHAKMAHADDIKGKPDADVLQMMESKVRPA